MFNSVFPMISKLIVPQAVFFYIYYFFQFMA